MVFQSFIYRSSTIQSFNHFHSWVMRVQPFKKLFVHLFTSIIRFFILSGDNVFYNFAAKTMQIHWHVEFDGISRHTLLDLYWYEIFGAYAGTCIDMGSDTWIVSHVGLWINMLVDIHLHRLSVVMAISVSRRGPCGRCGTLQEFGYDYMTT